MPTHNATRKRKARPADQASLPSHRSLRFLLIFVATALIANAVLGEGGLIATRAAKRHAMALAAEIEMVQVQNDALRGQAKELRTDPKAIESVARDELGLMRKGELLILLHDGPGIAEH